jgi:hypothetical protein
MPEIVYLDSLNPPVEEVGVASRTLIAKDTGLNSLAPIYSGVVVNQNVAPASGNDAFAFEDDFVIQEFFLPDGYRRGTESDEITFPSISGIQIMVECLVNSQVAEVEWFLEYDLFGTGWVRSGSGTATGLANAAPRSWFNIFFDDPVEVTEANVDTRMRIGIKSTKNVTKWWYSVPNPLRLAGLARAYASDGTTALTRPSDAAEYSFCFRILGLTADEGTDFLGNQYRSSIRQAAPVNVSTSLGADPDTYWLSKPNPSKFAVENLYFDVRKAASTKYGLRNWVSNPNGTLGDTTGWTAFSNSGVANVIALADGSAISGHAIQVFAAGVTTSGHKVRATNTERSSTNAAHMVRVGNEVVFRGRVKVVSASGPVTRLQLNRLAYQDPDTAIDTVEVMGFDSPVIGTWYDFDGVVTAGANVSYYDMEAALIVGGAGDFVIEVERFQMTPLPNDTIEDPGYFDGDTAGHVWAHTRHSSNSYELIPPTAQDVSSVVDRVTVDPVTPGAYFNIYYTQEGEEGRTESEWENKLWTRVPQTYRMERRETHVLPEPVAAKFIKIEFSHLQARHYSAGDFEQPIRYKKHPKWVLDYFIARLAADLQNPFLAERVAVIYDALDLAYNYYLDDLGQEPQTTVDVNNTTLTQVTNFLSDRADASDKVDPYTLNQVSLTLDTYRNHPALRGVSTTLLADYARQSVDPTADYSIEEGPPEYSRISDVSTLNRDRVVLEQDYPVMFFFLTCRHTYREVEAKFSHDRAYFAGVREVAFLRDNYMTAFDTGTYIEPNADTLNIERNEFS